MIRHFTFIILFFTTTFVSSQKKYVHQLYNHQLCLVNPAAAGTNKSNYSIYAYQHKQWFGIEGSPSSTILSLEGPLSKSVGVGCYLSNDLNGAVHEIQWQSTLSYEVTLLKTKRQVSTLSFGLGLNTQYINFNIDKENIDILYDPVFLKSNSGFGLNANAGFLWKLNGLYTGVSMVNLLPRINQAYDSELEPKLNRGVFLIGGYSHQIKKREIFFEESIVFIRKNSADRQFELNFKNHIIDDNSDWSFWYHLNYTHVIGQSFGKAQSFKVTPGITFKNIIAGFEYEFFLTDAIKDYGSSCKIVLGYKIKTDKHHKRFPCIMDKTNPRHQMYKYVSY